MTRPPSAMIYEIARYLQGKQWSTLSDTEKKIATTLITGGIVELNKDAQIICI